MSTTITPPPVQTFDTSVARFRRHLQDRATDFFPELKGSVRISLSRHLQRHHSQLLQFDAISDSTSRRVVYKIPFCLSRLEQAEFPVEQRPRLFSEIDPLTNGLREFRSLQSVEHHFNRLQDNRFGVIRMFDLLEQPYVEVMSFCADADLKSILKRATRLHRPTDLRADAAMENAGAWLAEFHRMPELPHTENRHQHRTDFTTAVERFVSFLADRTDDSAYFAQLGQRVLQAAERELPDAIPSAVVHGDFAPRNILVADNARVTVFDMQRRWRAPLFEDLAYFLMSLKASGPQVRSQGLIFSSAQLATWQQRFLHGYFGTDVPANSVQLYEILLTLEWWAASVCRLNRKGVKQRAGLWLTNRYLFRHLDRLVGGIA